MEATRQRVLVLIGYGSRVLQEAGAAVDVARRRWGSGADDVCLVLDVLRSAATWHDLIALRSLTLQGERPPRVHLQCGTARITGLPLDADGQETQVLGADGTVDPAAARGARGVRVLAVDLVIAVAGRRAA